jgi:hypothetical protein
MAVAARCGESGRRLAETGRPEEAPENAVADTALAIPTKTDSPCKPVGRPPKNIFLLSVSLKAGTGEFSVEKVFISNGHRDIKRLFCKIF